jgi:hypothetical protein
MNLEQLKNETLLFLGKSMIFSDTEISNFLATLDIEFTRSYNGQKHVVEHRMINPVEEDISNMAYEAKATFYKMELFEQSMSEMLDINSVLMAIKLGNDSERIKRMLANEYINDELYIKLLNLYQWEEESFGDSTSDRDVLTHTLKRFLDLNFNETDLYFSPLSLLKLAKEAQNRELLLALINFPNVEFLQKNKSKINLKEAIAQSPHIDRKITKKLLSFKDDSIEFFIASNEAVELDILKVLHGKSKNINQALASNEAIDDELFEKLLDEHEILLKYQPINIHRYNLSQGIKDANSILADNHNLDTEVIKALFKQGDESINKALLGNPNFPTEYIQRFYNGGNQTLYQAIAKHPKTPVKILQELLTLQDKTINSALAGNSSTPQTILIGLSHHNEFEIDKALASNPSTPLEVLNILKIDTRLRNELTHNKTFTDSIVKSQKLYW